MTTSARTRSILLSLELPPNQAFNENLAEEADDNGDACDYDNDNYGRGDNEGGGVDV
jgi:hypothetical protein